MPSAIVKDSVVIGDHKISVSLEDASWKGWSFASRRLNCTVVVPVKNEAENLSECLAALDGFAEIVVVDSASTDRTVKIAKGTGATVLNFEWAGGFPKKRNWVLQTFSFKTEWVLFLDADEKATPEFKSAVARAIQKTDCVGF